MCFLFAIIISVYNLKHVQHVVFSPVFIVVNATPPLDNREFLLHDFTRDKAFFKHKEKTTNSAFCAFDLVTSQEAQQLSWSAINSLVQTTFTKICHKFASFDLCLSRKVSQSLMPPDAPIQALMGGWGIWSRHDDNHSLHTFNRIKSVYCCLSFSSE